MSKKGHHLLLQQVAQNSHKKLGSSVFQAPLYSSRLPCNIFLATALPFCLGQTTFLNFSDLFLDCFSFFILFFLTLSLTKYELGG